MKGSFRIGDWSVDPNLGTLTNHGTEMHIEPRTMQVLVYLAEHAGEVVSKEELFQKVWEETFVTDEALSYCIWNLRKALGDQAKEPRYIQTIPKKGYRLIAAVVTEVAEARGIDVERSPYPGLVPFSEAAAEYFFGREEEVALLRERVARLGLLALIGPSGVGKSSLVRAGLLPSLPQGWRAVVCHPGEKPLAALADALVPELAGDTEATRTLLRMAEPDMALSVLRRWQDAHLNRILVIDQFEELFTLNPEEVQSQFAEILGRAARETGLHLLLVLRDDFLMHCQRHKSLAPVFTELTALGPPSPEALHRALVEPARRCGYVFEDETLPDEMVAEVGKERGALPLLAFAAARLWEKRDRDRRLLTRKAYQEIGGVAGALAQHAESTLESIGIDNQDIAREIFRNLMTSQGTRATRDWEDLLSVFPARATAEEVLQALVGSRLLTSYELPSQEGEASTHRVEIIHESLLKHWPRLVRWQTQDADSAQLRDQLRQASQLWESRGRPTELLWAGKPFRQLQVWREDYPGRLSKTEEAFAGAMVQNAGRRRRRRRMVAASVVAIIGIVTTLWQRSELSRQEALQEAKRREAAQLLALGRLRLEEYPSAALAYAIGSLERADSADARRFALEALWQGPTAFVLPKMIPVAFSPDGRWLATGMLGQGVRLWSERGGPPQALSGAETGPPHLQFNSESDLLVEGGWENLRFWSIPDLKLTRHLKLDRPAEFAVRASRLVTLTSEEQRLVVRSQLLAGGDSKLLARWVTTDLPERITDISPQLPYWDVDTSGEWMAYARGHSVYVARPEDVATPNARLVGKHSTMVAMVRFHPGSDRVVSADETGEIRVWSLSGRTGSLERTIAGVGLAGEIVLDLDRSGSRLVAAKRPGHATSEVAYIWDLAAPPDADPQVLRNSDATLLYLLAMHPAGLWAATGNGDFGILWPLTQRHARILRGQSPPYINVAFTPDGKWLASCSDAGMVRLWPLSASAEERSRILMEDKTALLGTALSIDPTGKYLLAASRFDFRAFLVPLHGGNTRLLPGAGTVETDNCVAALAFSPDGRLAAAGVSACPARISLWDIHSGEVRSLVLRAGDVDCGPMGVEFVFYVGFTGDGGLISACTSGIWLWDLEDGTSKRLRPSGVDRDVATIAVSASGRHVLVADVRKFQGWFPALLNLEDGSSREITSHGTRVSAVALDPSGTIAVTGDFDGVVRVGPITGEEPHLLLGHRLEISSVAVSSDGRWIASGSQDGTIRLWPMPDMNKPPFHTLPYEELLARLRNVTNLRVVEDRQSSTGYRLEVGPFPGWERVPEW